MTVQRKDDRHDDDLVNEIAAGFNQALSSKRKESDEPAPEPPKFSVTGDSRTSDSRPRRSR